MYFLGSIKLNSSTAPVQIETQWKKNINEHDRVGNSSVVKPNGRKAIRVKLSFTLLADTMEDSIEDFMARLVQLSDEEQQLTFAAGFDNVWNRIWGKVYIEEVTYTIITNKGKVSQATGSVNLVEVPKIKKRDIYVANFD